MTAARDNVVQFPTTGLLVPEGQYQLAFERYAVSTRFGRGSLELWFRVMNYGRHFQQPVCRYYKVEREGKRSFRASPHSAYVREFVAIFGKAPPAGTQGVSWYRDTLIEGRVRTVSRNHKQKSIPEPVRYSVVDELIRRVEA